MRRLPHGRERLEQHRPHRGGRGHTGGLPTLYWVLLLLVCAAVGWVQLSRYEAKLQALHEASGSAISTTTDGGLQGYLASTDSLKRGPQSSSQMCAAKLEANGILPNLKGRWVHRAADAASKGGENLLIDGAAHDQDGGSGGSGSGGGGTGKGDAVAAAATVNLVFSRRRLYDGMEASLRSKGLALGGTTTQGLGLGDMFTVGEDGLLKPVLQALAVPVRAIVLPLLDPQASGRLLGAVKRHLVPLVPANGIWLQDSHLYHSTIYHASTHTDPVPAAAAAVDSEVSAIRAVGQLSCPLHVVLERVVATSAGTVVACWQVAKGTDVFELRRQLALALPGASKQQIVKDHSILHTTLARMVATPHVTRLADQLAAGGSSDDDGGSSRGDGSNGGGGSGGGLAAAGQRKQRQGVAGRREQPAGKAEAEAVAREEAAAVLQAAVDRMTAELCGLEVILDKLWFAEEHDKLALALQGRVSIRDVPLECSAGLLDSGGGTASEARNMER